jgi:hypothetical protein
MMTGIVPPRRGQLAAAALARLAPPRLLPSGDDLAAMATTIEAEDSFDLAACRRPIRAPTLILVGSADHWYSRELFAETARLIPGSRLRVFEGRGHISVYKHPEWTRDIKRFLSASAPSQKGELVLKDASVKLRRRPIPSRVGRIADVYDANSRMSNWELERPRLDGW